MVEMMCNHVCLLSYIVLINRLNREDSISLFVCSTYVLYNFVFMQIQYIVTLKLAYSLPSHLLAHCLSLSCTLSSHTRTPLFSLFSLLSHSLFSHCDFSHTLFSHSLLLHSQHAQTISTLTLYSHRLSTFILLPVSLSSHTL